MKFKDLAIGDCFRFTQHGLSFPARSLLSKIDVHRYLVTWVGGSGSGTSSPDAPVQRTDTSGLPVYPAWCQREMSDCRLPWRQCCEQRGKPRACASCGLPQTESPCGHPCRQD